MSVIRINQSHSLGREETRHRVAEIAKGLNKEYKIDYVWKGDQFQFKCASATGLFDLGERGVEVKIKLGLGLAPMKGKIE